MIKSIKRNGIAAVAAFAFGTAAQADTCPYKSDLTLAGTGTQFRIARPEGEPMCVTIQKSAGLSAGRITVVTVRQVFRASSSEIEVTTTKERSRQRGQAAHASPDLSTPELLGGAQMFINSDDETHMTIRAASPGRLSPRLGGA